MLLRAMLAAALLMFGLTAFPGAAYAADYSLGTDFWLSFPTNFDTVPALQLFVTGPTATTGAVSIPGQGGWSQTFTVVPGIATKIVLPTTTTQNAQMSTDDGVEAKGIHVTTAAPVSVYGLNRIQASTDAFLGLPTNVLGTTYVVLSYPGFAPAGQLQTSGSEFTVTATQNATAVTVTPSADVKNADGTVLHSAGVPFTITLDAGDAYQLRTADTADLTGSLVTADKPVSVFGASRCAQVPTGTPYCDFLVEEMTPPTSWGKKFVTEPLATRKSGDTFRILAENDGTNVTINGTQVATLGAGKFLETTLTAASTITTDQPVLVAQYSKGSTVDKVTSDPFVMLIPPYEQFLNSYTVATPDSQFGFTNYVNVVAPTADAGLVMADGSAVPATAFHPIPGSTFSGAQLAVSTGSHTYTGPDPFGVYVYGFASNDSYGYPGGTSMAPVATVASVTLSPSAETTTLDAQACKTATVLDQYANPVPDVRVDFTVSGANSTTGSVTAGADGIAQFCYTAMAIGTDTITAAVGTVTGTASETWGWNDTTPPTLTGSPTTAPNAAGWYRGDVPVHWTATDDDGGSGIDPATVPADSYVTGEGTGLTTTATVADRAGNVTTGTSAPAVDIDRTAPTTTAAAPAGWVDDGVQVTLTADDALSGPASTTWQLDGGPQQTATDMPATTVPITTEGQHTLTFFSTDEAGNAEAPQQVTVRIDKTAPTIDHAQAPAANALGWNNSAVTVTFTCVDTGSGVASCLAALDGAAASPDSPLTVSGDAQHTVHLSATDNAANAASSDVAVHVDTTKPTITGTASAANGNGWHNSPITVTFTCNDGLSGVSACSEPVVLSTDGTDLSADGTTTDAAGNTAAASVGGLKLDQVPPTISGAPTTAPNAAGWYRTPVVVHFDCTDDRSGVGVCPSDATLTGDGAGQAVDATARDNAGNTAKGSVTGIDIDRTPPAITAAFTPEGAASGWYTGAVTVHFTCTDEGSGVASCPADQTVSGDGAEQSIQGTAVDNAGNTASVDLGHLNIDAAPPTITWSATPAANANGWRNHDVTVAFACADALSGVDSCTAPVTLSEGAHQTVVGTAVDRAGNSASVTTAEIDVDETRPTVTFTGNAGTYTVDQTVAIGCSASDALSGIGSASCPDASGPAYSFGLGARTLTGSATDKAGNTASASASFTVVVTANSLCALTQRLVTTPNDANAFCVKLTHGQTGAYENAVSATKGKSVTADNANLLIKLAQQM